MYLCMCMHDVLWVYFKVKQNIRLFLPLIFIRSYLCAYSTMITMETIRKRALALAEVTFEEAFEIDTGTVAYIHDVLTLCVYVLCVLADLNAIMVVLIFL